MIEFITTRQLLALGALMQGEAATDEVAWTLEDTNLGPEGSTVICLRSLSGEGPDMSDETNQRYRADTLVAPSGQCTAMFPSGRIEDVTPDSIRASLDEVSHE